MDRQPNPLPDVLLGRGFHTYVTRGKTTAGTRHSGASPAGVESGMKLTDKIGRWVQFLPSKENDRPVGYQVIECPMIKRRTFNAHQTCSYLLYRDWLGGKDGA